MLKKGLLYAKGGIVKFLGGVGSGEGCVGRKVAGGPGASKLVVKKWKGAETFPEFPCPSILTRQTI